MRETVARTLSLALAAVLAACGAPARMQDGPSTLTRGMVPMSGKAAPGRAAIRATLFDICDRSLGDLSDSVLPFIDDPAVSPEVRIDLLRTQLRIGTTIVATATTRSVESGVVDMYCYLAVCEARLSQRLADSLPDRPEVVRLEAAIQVPLAMARGLLESTATVEQVEFVDRALAGFLERDVNSSPGLLLRLDDFADLRASTDRIATGGSGLLGTVDEARDEIRSTRESAELVSYAIQRMPTLARWHARLLLEEALAGPSTGRAYAALDALATRLGELGTSLYASSQAIDRVDARVAETVEALGEVDGPLARTMAEARATIADAKALRESLDGTMPALDLTLGAARETLESLRGSVADVEDLRAKLKEDGVTLDPAAARETAQELAAAAADLKVALGEARAVLSSDDASARLEEIVSASRTATDYVFWRAGLLLLIAACLAIVLRVAWVLTGRRGKA